VLCFKWHIKTGYCIKSSTHINVKLELGTQGNIGSYDVGD